MFFQEIGITIHAMQSSTVHLTLDLLKTLLYLLNGFLSLLPNTS